MEKVQLPNGRVEWAMSSRTYVKNAVKVVESLIAEDDPEAKLKTTALTVVPASSAAASGTPRSNLLPYICLPEET